jgi:hypothetical protein
VNCNSFIAPVLAVGTCIAVYTQQTCSRTQTISKVSKSTSSTMTIDPPRNNNIDFLIRRLDEVERIVGSKDASDSRSTFLQLVDLKRDLHQLQINKPLFKTYFNHCKCLKVSTTSINDLILHNYSRTGAKSVA